MAIAAQRRIVRAKVPGGLQICRLWDLRMGTHSMWNPFNVAALISRETDGNGVALFGR